jgi:hypothetical protein
LAHSLGWKDILLRVYDHIGKDRIVLVAAGVTFYCLLGIFPAIAALVAIYGFFTDPVSISSQVDKLLSATVTSSTSPIVWITSLRVKEAIPGPPTVGKHDAVNGTVSLAPKRPRIPKMVFLARSSG